MTSAPPPGPRVAQLRRIARAIPWLPPVVAIVGVLALVAVAGIVGRDDPRAGSGGPVGDGTALTPPEPAPVPARVRALADGLSRNAQVAQLFLLDTGDRRPRFAGWGGFRVGPSGPSAAMRWSVRLRRAAGGVTPLLAANGLPSQPALAKASPAVVTEAYRAAAARLQRAGVTLGLGLSADVSFRGSALSGATFGGDPAAVGAQVEAALAGTRAAGLATSVGHFPGEGAATQSPRDGPASVGLSRRDLARRDLLPFRTTLGSAAAVTLSSAAYAAWDGVTPAALNPTIIGVELRRRLAFQGVAITGDLSELELATGASPARTAVAALRAGADVIEVSDEQDADAAARAVVAALGDGSLPTNRFREALGRVLELKRRSGLLSNALR